MKIFIAGARHPERVMQNDHVTPVKLGLHENVEEMRPALGDADAVYFTAGSGAKDLLQVIPSGRSSSCRRRLRMGSSAS